MPFDEPTTESPVPAADLSADTAVSRLERAPGWYVADLPDSWSYVTPSGGVLMTVAMRAMAAELADEGLQPVSATTLFMSPVPAGPLQIRVEVLRRGAVAAQLRAALSSTRKPGPGLEVSATFARDREGADVHGVEFPKVPPPAEALDASERAARAPGGRPRSMPPFYKNIDVALGYGENIWQKQGWTGGEARMAFWYRYRVPQRRGATLDPFAIPPLADTLPPALQRLLGPGAPRFVAPSLDLTVHFLDHTESEWLLVDNRCQRARAGYATADANIWDDRGKLVARATQVMMMRTQLPTG